MAYDYSQGMKRNLESEYQGGITKDKAKGVKHSGFDSENFDPTGLHPKSDSNPKDLLGIKKVRLDLVPPSSIIAQAAAMEEGADKYGPYNWRSKKVKASIYIAAILRHVLAYLDGEDADPDSVAAKTHLAGILASAGILVDAGETGNLIDDRPMKGTAAQILRNLTKK